MAKSWEEAQINELNFWDDIYLRKKNDDDIKSYTPVSKERALNFARKTIARFNIPQSFLKYCRACADVGCGPYGLVVGFDHISKKILNTNTIIYHFIMWCIKK